MQLAPAELFRLLQRQMGVKVRNGIYSARLVIWMMISQRLQARGTLASSVEQLVQGRFDPLLSQCKRAREKKIGLSIRAAGDEASRTEVETYKHASDGSSATLGELMSWKRER